MPLTNVSLPPSSLPQLDVSTVFSTGQTLTSSGYVNQLQQQVDLGGGLWEGCLILDISALDLSTDDQTYQLLFQGSNDPAFADGNVLLEINLSQDSLTVAPVSVPTIISFRGATSFRYLQLYAQLGGTTPSITLSAWLATE